MKKNDSKAIHLANRLWSIANDLRGNMDSIKFKNYILGIIFYRYLLERTESYINNLPQSFKKNRQEFSVAAEMNWR